MRSLSTKFLLIKDNFGQQLVLFFSENAFHKEPIIPKEKGEIITNKKLAEAFNNIFNKIGINLNIDNDLNDLASKTHFLTFKYVTEKKHWL